MLADISCEKYCSTCFISISVSVSVSMYYDSPKGQSCFVEDHVMHKQLHKCELPWFAVSCRQTLKILNLWPWWPHPTCQGGEGLRISYSFFLDYSPPKCLWGSLSFLLISWLSVTFSVRPVPTSLTFTTSSPRRPALPFPRSQVFVLFQT